MNINFLAGALMLCCGAVAAGIGNCIVFSKYLESITRQPEERNTLFAQMFIGIALVEALPIIAVAFGIMMILGIFK